MSKPEIGDRVKVKRIFVDNEWYKATVVLLLSAQFSFQLDIGVRGIMRYDSDDWEYMT